MKKVIIVFFIFFVVGSCALNNSFFYEMISIDKNAEISFYLTEKQYNFGGTEEKNGNGYIYTLNKNNKINNYFFQNCYGFSIKIYNFIFFDKIFSKINIIKIEKLEEKTIYYGNSNGLFFCDYMQGEKINIQIAKCKDYFVVGSPIILGSY